ncbi:MAG: LapA family protein [Gallionella sp.]|nr:LapA family protein [Gallionella sp.]
MNLKLILVLLLSAMAVLFIAQNVAVVEIGFLYWRWTMSSSVLIFSNLMIGFVLGWFTHSFLSARQTKRILNSAD